MVTWAQLLYFIASLVTLTGFAVFAVLVAMGPIDFFGILALGAAIAVPVGLLTLVLIILFLIGYFTLHSNRRELGPAHEKNVDRSLLLFIGLIVAFIVVQVVVFAFVFITLFSSFLPPGPSTPPPQPTPEQLQQSLLPVLLVGQGLDIFVALLVALFLFYIVVALLPSLQQFRLRIAMALFVIGSAASFVITLVLFVTDNLFLPAFLDEATLLFPPLSFQYQDILAGTVKSALQTSAAFLFWRVYKFSYDAVREGSVQPLARSSS